MILNAHSYYSLRYGLAKIQTLVDGIISKGYERIAFTDINNSTGCLEFVKECQARNIPPVVGIEFRDGDELLYIGIAKNNKGFRELNDFLSDHNLQERKLPEVAPELPNVYFIYEFGKRDFHHLNENEFIGIRRHQLGKIVLQPKKYFTKYVILHSVTHNGKAYELHKLLRAIDHNCLITELKENQIAHKNDYFPTKSELLEWYKNFPEIISNTQSLLSSCSFSFDFKAIKNKKTYTGDPLQDRALIRKLAYEGMGYRYGDGNKNAKEKIEYELSLIDQLDFAAYFLITWDMVQFSLSKGFYHVGRGSGANSIVSYCLRITNVCPITLDLSVERFINPERKTPPDFDIDYSWNQRDEVIAYLFKKYGYRHVAWLGTMSTFQQRAPIRELGKVFGLPKAEIDHLIAYPDDLFNKNHIAEGIQQFTKYLADFPNQRSLHAGGILITEDPITNYVALDLPPKGFPTTQFDMYIAEDAGILKLDVLSQRGIGHIYDCARIVKENQGIDIKVHDFEGFQKDEKIKALIRNADTMGAFYVESPYMRGLFDKLRCDDFITLVAASSIIRPGVSQSGMMGEFIARHNDPSRITYLHPIMEEQLKETYGIMVYQEDVLHIAHHYGLLTMTESDVLRRMMSGKTRGKQRLIEIKEKFFSNCKSAGRPDDITAKVWEMMESFAGYSFSKAHSASYAVQSYESLHLKAHYPREFMVAVLNNQGGFYQPRFYVQEARKWGADIQLPCVNEGEYLCSIKGIQLYIGFMFSKSLRVELAQQIVSSRKKHGLFTSLEDLIERINVGIEQLIILIRSGALRFTGKSKKQLLWDAHAYFRSKETNKKYGTGNQVLFSFNAQLGKMPALYDQAVEDLYDEFELIGFPVSKSYFDLLVTSYRGNIEAQELRSKVGSAVRIVGNLVDYKRIKTYKNEYMYFANFLDHKNNAFDTTHFPSSLKDYPFQGSGIYLIEGTVVIEFNHPSINVIKFAKLPLKSDPRRD